MIPRAQVEAVLQRLRPLLQADGGDVELVDIDGCRAMVRLTGACAGCPSAHLTLHLGIETALKEAVAGLEELILV